MSGEIVSSVGKSSIRKLAATSSSFILFSAIYCVKLTGAFPSLPSSQVVLSALSTLTLKAITSFIKSSPKVELGLVKAS